MIITTVLSTARTLRRRYLPTDASWVASARSATQWALRRVPGWSEHGVSVALGDSGVLRIAPELLVGSLDFSHWGIGRNAGFRAWIDACRGKRVVCDIGAHIGLYTIPGSRVLAPGGRCYAFEPAAANADVLDRHLRYNAAANVEVVRAIVGAREATAVSFFEQPTVVGMNSLAVRTHRERYLATTRPQVALDGFFAARAAAPEVIKIDVEGAELRVLCGARRLLARDHPTLILSVHPRELELLGDSAEGVYGFLTALGYAIALPDGRVVTALGAEEYIVRPQATSV